MSTISPEGYRITRDPVNNNPFWEIEIDGAHIKSLTCSKTTEDQYDYYNWSYVDELDESHHIITQKVANAAGITFTPSVSPEGIISWTNDGGLPNPSPVNIKGLTGDTGATGATGATPNITMTATADATASATPTVVVTKTGTDENPSFAFAFSGLKGEQGPRGITGADGAPGEQGLPGVDGVSPVVSAQATVDQSTGVPSVSVTKTGSDAAPVFNFAFSNIKGETGEQGEKGDPGDVGAMPVITATASVGAQVGTPSVVVSKTGTAAAPNLDFAFSNLKGERGQTGPQGVSPEVTVEAITGGHAVTITDEDHPSGQTFNVMDGQDGMGTVAVGTTTTGQPGTNASVVNSGTAQNAILDFTIPQGAQGPAGQDGADGADGAAATIAVGTVTTGQPGTQATVTNSGTSSAAVFDFTIPQGAAGQNGTNGQGVPTGGTAGQVLAKRSGTNYDTEWVTPSGGGGEYIEVVGTSGMTYSTAIAALMALVDISKVTPNSELVIDIANGSSYLENSFVCGLAEIKKESGGGFRLAYVCNNMGSSNITKHMVYMATNQYQDISTYYYMYADHNTMPNFADRSNDSFSDSHYKMRLYY